MHYSFCIIAYLFLGAMIYTMFSCSKCKPFTTYQNTLDEKQLKMYEEVVKNRALTALYGIILGIFIAFITYYKYKIDGCCIVSVIMMTQYLFYMLVPKKSMFMYLEKKEQFNGWYDVYKYMQNRYYIGMLFGIIVFFMIGRFS